MSSNQIFDLETVRLRLNAAFDKAGLSQADLLRKIKQNGHSFSQSSLSKLLKDGVGLTKIDNILVIAQALNIDLNSLLSPESFVDVRLNDAPSFSATKVQEHSNLIRRADDSNVIPYLTTYHVYFFPTISDEHKILSGELTFSPSSDMSQCIATMVLKTGKKSRDGHSNEKKYSGRMVVSKILNTVYCTLESDVLGEVSHISFRTRYFTSDKLYDCGLALAMTVCAGDTRLPTVHRLILSRKEIPNDCLEQIQGQLNLNSSNILISEENLKMLVNTKQLNSSIVSRFAVQENDGRIKTFCYSHPVRYFEFDEGSIRTAKDIDKDIRSSTVNLLRKFAVSPLYCKLSDKCNYFIRETLVRYGIYPEDNNQEDSE